MPSTFPQKKDVIDTFIDVSASDTSLLKSFETYMINGDFINANKILSQISNADRKIITANRLNQIIDCLNAVEQFYGTDIKPYISQKQVQWQSIIDQFRLVDTYSSSIQYKVNNMVLYYIEGDYNLYIRTNGDGLAGYPPTDTRYWRALTVKGEQGQSYNELTTFYFDWKSNQTYSKNAIVVHNNQWWISLQENIGQEPLEGSKYWSLVMRAMQTIYPVQTPEPVGQIKGELWFEVMI